MEVDPALPAPTTNTPAERAASMAAALPPPLVRFRGHPLRWIRLKLELSVDAVVLAHIGVLIVAALYYLITQTDHSVKHWWDTTVTPSSVRHDIRDVGEGVLASCLAQAIVWDPFKRSHRHTGRNFRVLHERFHVPIGFAAAISAAVVGTVAYLIGDGVLHLLSVRSTSHTVAGSLWNRTATLWNSQWDKKALGFVAALAARRPLHIVFDEVQAYFAERRAAADRPLRFYHPPVFRARYNYLKENMHQVRRYPVALTVFMGIALVAGVGLAGFGYYVLTYKA